jgi:hypothetical protein
VFDLAFRKFRPEDAAFHLDILELLPSACSRVLESPDLARYSAQKRAAIAMSEIATSHGIWLFSKGGAHPDERVQRVRGCAKLCGRFAPHGECFCAGFSHVPAVLHPLPGAATACAGVRLVRGVCVEGGQFPEVCGFEARSDLCRDACFSCLALYWGEVWGLHASSFLFPPPPPSSASAGQRASCIHRLAGVEAVHRQAGFMPGAFTAIGPFP